MPTQTNYTKIKRLNVFDGEKDLQKFLEVNFTESLKQMIKVTVKTMVKQEMESFRKQFEEKIYFNGCYDRNMISSFGKIEDVPTEYQLSNRKRKDYLLKIFNCLSLGIMRLKEILK